jgi:hypothetical protein
MSGSWLRDLPLLLGLAASAGVIASSTLVSGPPPPLPRAAPADAQNATLRGNTATPESASADSVPIETAKPGKRAGGDRAGKPSHRKTPRSAGTKATPKPAAAPKAKTTPRVTATPRSTATPRPNATPERTATATPTPTPTPPPAPRGPVQVKGTKAQVLAGSVTFTMSATSHAPKVGDGWTLEATATRNGSPLPGRVTADAIFQGNPVYDIDTGRLKAGRYRYHDIWPQRAAGVPLTIRLKVKAGGRQQVFLFDLQVANKPTPPAP